MPTLGNGFIGGAAMLPPTFLLQSEIVSVAHTNGTQSVIFNSGGVGESNQIAGSVGAGVDGNGDLTLTGTWSTVAPSKGVMTKLTVHTNLVASDIVSASYEDFIYQSMQAHQVSSSSATSGARFYQDLGNGAGTVLTTGPSYNGDIGDIGTIYYEDNSMSQVYNNNNEAYKVCGGNYAFGWPANIVSNGYFSYLMQIHGDYPTKTYKFRFDLEYY